jgi:hypothetical protein
MLFSCRAPIGTCEVPSIVFQDDDDDDDDDDEMYHLVFETNGGAN